MTNHAPTILEYLKSRDWRSHSDRVILLSVIIILSLLASAYFELSIGLAAICLLLWIEIPSAYREKLDTLWSKRFMVFASKMFFISGAFFTYTAITDSFIGQTSLLGGNVIIGGETQDFVAGIIAFLVALFFTYLVVDKVATGGESSVGFSAFELTIAGGLILLDAIYLIDMIANRQIFAQYFPLQIFLLGDLYVVFAILAIPSSVIALLTLREKSPRGIVAIGVCLIALLIRLVIILSVLLGVELGVKLP